MVKTRHQYYVTILIKPVWGLTLDCLGGARAMVVKLLQAVETPFAVGGGRGQRLLGARRQAQTPTTLARLRNSK